VTIALTTWIAAGAIAGAVALAGVQTVRLANERTAHATSKQEFADARTESARLTAQAETEQREKFERRIKGKDDAINQAQKLADGLRLAADRAKRADSKLRQSTAELVARAREACGRSGTGSASATADDPIGVLADVSGRIDERAGVLAEYADRARVAGQTCERQYDSLNK